MTMTCLHDPAEVESVLLANVPSGLYLDALLAITLLVQLDCDSASGVVADGADRGTVHLLEELRRVVARHKVRCDGLAEAVTDELFDALDLEGEDRSGAFFLYARFARLVSAVAGRSQSMVPMSGLFGTTPGGEA